MTFNKYEEEIEKSLAKYIREMDNIDSKLTEFILGIAEEAAEVSSPIRRSIKGNYHETDIDYEHLCEEIGDVLWYISSIANHMEYYTGQQVHLSDIATFNLNKINIKHQLKCIHNSDVGIGEYSSLTKKTYDSIIEKLPDDEKSRIFCLGLHKEVGKVSELFGEHIFHNEPLDTYKLIEKLGDTLWYLAAISHVTTEKQGMDLETIARKNVAKALKRYNSSGEVIRE